jgi:putative endonuclease
MPVPDAPATPYWLYLLECKGGRLYAGIAIDVEERFFQHVFAAGAKFTRAFPPLRVVAAREYASRSAALRAEIQLKKLPRAEKLRFFDGRISPERSGP